EFPGFLVDDVGRGETEPAEPPAHAVVAPAPVPLAPPVDPMPVEAPAPPAWTWATVAAWTMPAVALPWPAGAPGRWWRTARAAWRFERALRQAADAPAEVRMLAGRLADDLGVQTPRVAIADSVVSPMLWVWAWTATLVLPRVLFERLSPEQQTMLLV